jgi:hypothetical protein
MAHTIEEAKSGRATCRTCREKIDKGALRFGEETPNAFDPGGAPSYLWHHLLCAAKRRAAEVKVALETFAGNLPNRAELDAILSAPPKGADKPPFPYAERAPTGRSKCVACSEPIDRDALRVAIEREVDTGSFMTKGAGYLHARCALAHLENPGLLATLKQNSRGLDERDFAELAQGLTAAS